MRVSALVCLRISQDGRCSERIAGNPSVHEQRHACTTRHNTASGMMHSCTTMCGDDYDVRILCVCITPQAALGAGDMQLDVLMQKLLHLDIPSITVCSVTEISSAS